jgi:hypothetical protein
MDIKPGLLHPESTGHPPGLPANTPQKSPSLRLFITGSRLSPTPNRVGGFVDAPNAREKSSAKISASCPAPRVGADGTEEHSESDARKKNNRGAMAPIGRMKDALRLLRDVPIGSRLRCVFTQFFRNSQQYKQPRLVSFLPQTGIVHSILIFVPGRHRIRRSVARSSGVHVHARPLASR